MHNIASDRMSLLVLFFFFSCIVLFPLLNYIFGYHFSRPCYPQYRVVFTDTASGGGGRQWRKCRFTYRNMITQPAKFSWLNFVYTLHLVTHMAEQDIHATKAASLQQLPGFLFLASTTRKDQHHHMKAGGHIFFLKFLNTDNI